MPKRNDISKILLIGSGPIVIGQACEFDYSGAQACKALREEGYEVVLVNSNPATIMTDPEMATRTYIEPLTVEYLTDIIAKERPQALLPTMGGQTALNLAVELSQKGILQKYNVELIGASEKAIMLAENRGRFKKVLEEVQVEFPKSFYVKKLEEGLTIVDKIGFPCIIRPSFTLGGAGASIAYNIEDFTIECAKGIEASPVGEVLVEESVLGWKEFELEVIRDNKDNVVIICSIENFDPMGVHTGDSITVAPIQTLTDVEYQKMRDSAIRIIRAVGVDTGGSNIQFAVHPKTGRQVAIEMNPRVSRSSALASKATGFPIAKIATKLAVGYSLDEIPNDITKKTPSCFEPSIDYVVTKIPRFAFEKFPRSDSKLSPQMKSVGEVMAIGRTFKQSIQKALRSLEIKLFGFNQLAERRKHRTELGWVEGIRNYIQTPKPDRILWIAQGFREGLTVDEIATLTHIDPWFLSEIKEITDIECDISQWTGKVAEIPKDKLLSWKKSGFSDLAIATHTKSTDGQIRAKRDQLAIKPGYKMVDTCAAEFESKTPYLYSTFDGQSDITPHNSPKKVIILGGGPNRIGQGIEFDYCCVQASIALREEGFESIMVNCNPETVSTDYDVSDKLYFEPLFLEDILNLIEEEKPFGVVVHFGGQTPLNLSKKLASFNIPILGTSAQTIECTEDRDKFRALCHKLKIRQPESVTVSDMELAEEAALQLGFPLLVRPSYVLGGGGMEIIYNIRDFQKWAMRGLDISPECPLLIDRFLKNAIEVDVDAICDGDDVLICGMMEQIQEAGVHSGDSSCTLPCVSLSKEIQTELKNQTTLLARELKVKGLINIQYAIEDGIIYVLEVNPRASRTVPFASKARAFPFAKIAMKVMLGRKLKEFPITDRNKGLFFVKESVFPFNRFAGTDIILGPEMRSTGEVMGVGRSFPEAFGKAVIAAGFRVPLSGCAFLSVRDADKPQCLSITKELIDLGFSIVATKGTAIFLTSHGLTIKTVNKVNEGRPHVVDHLKNGEIDLVINTSALGVHEVGAAFELRRTTLMRNLCYFTTIAAAKAGVKAIHEMRRVPITTHCLQDG